MRALGIVLIILALTAGELHACRFTVREIGFSVLSQDIYTLAVIDANADAHDPFWQNYHKKNKDCNVRLEVLNPDADANHPVVKNAKRKGMTFPCTLLVSPDQRIYSFGTGDMEKIYNEILETDLGVSIRSAVPDVFAVVVWLEGKDEAKNRVLAQKVKEECEAIENIMPGMPKLVEHGPVSKEVSKADFDKEKLLLWSLGIEAIPDSPQAFVLYGRGRKIGKVLSFEEVQEGGLYKYMSMIGADCECGLDKKWMLGNQVPLLWDRESRQHLAELVGFDVDNPMILAEMSRILAKESLSGETGSVAFAPETIDLDAVFGASEEAKEQKSEAAPGSRSKNILLYTLIGLFVVVIAGGIIVFVRK